MVGIPIHFSPQNHTTGKDFAVVGFILLGWMLLTFILWLIFGGKSK